ncbi:MAG: co-chaperone DjlA [Steroidobacteraceae bacterium]
MWYGKLIGALIGLFAGRGLAGAIIGAFIGHLFDVERSQGKATRGAQQVQQVFFRVTFQLMGHVAKADGRVSEQEIQAARAMMAQFRLSEAEVRRAIELFSAGKAADFPLNEALRELAAASGNRTDLRLMFVQIQLQTALLGGGLNPASRAILQRCCAVLGISATQFAQMESMLRMQGHAGDATQRRSASSLSEAYQVLGVSSSASDAEVTKAYRRLMSQNHPDKLVAKGLPESMMKAAEEKTRSVLAAYEVICEARGIK